MATKEMKVCDVCPTTRNIATYTVQVTRTSQGDSAIPDVTHQKDLCPRHRKRLDHFIFRGTTPPGSKAK